jgi:alkylation response protein AidB-like acyl-CoA dehydrogenase
MTTNQNEVAADLESALVVVAQHAAAVDAEAKFPRASLDALRNAGLLGLLVSTDVGGLGLGFGDAARVVERVAAACGSTAMVLTMHYSGSAVIEKLGPVAIRREIAAGRHLSTLAFSEQGSRSHFWAALGTATRSPEGVRLDARKSWVTSAHHADSYVWSSRPLEAEGMSSLWIVPRTTPGLRPLGQFAGLGLRGNDSTAVQADGAVVPESALLGADGAGFDTMMSTVLPLFNLCSAACSIGLSEAALARATAHVAGTRHDHLSSSLAELPTVRAYLAKARIQADATRTLWLDAIAALESGRADTMLRVLQVKAAANESAVAVTQDCMRICGGAAFRLEAGIERPFRDARAGFVMAPTSDQLHDFVGKAITGLPLF